MTAEPNQPAQPDASETCLPAASRQAPAPQDDGGVPLAIQPLGQAPFLHASEGAARIFFVTLLAACIPLAGGIVLFGWRAAIVAALCIVSCVVIEQAYYRVTRVPALLGRSHAVLTGVLLALTLPAFVPWYVPVVASAFAIIVGKAVLGGVGHFMWQPALVGRLAVSVLFAGALAGPDARFPMRQPVLDRAHLLQGDVLRAAVGEERGDIHSWKSRVAPANFDALLMMPPTVVLRGLTDNQDPAFSALVTLPSDAPSAKPAALLEVMSIKNLLLWGTRPGGIGETSILLLTVAGLYLIYRNYIKWELPFFFLTAAWATVAVAPVYLAGPNDTVRTCWLPLLTPEGLAVAFTYINYQIFSGGLALAVLLASAEMTSRPVTAGGQVLFATGCGVLAMLLQLYTPMPIPCFMAVLAMNTLTPTIDRLWRPRVFGTRRFAFLPGR